MHLSAVDLSILSSNVSTWHRFADTSMVGSISISWEVAFLVIWRKMISAFIHFWSNTSDRTYSFPVRHRVYQPTTEHMCTYSLSTLIHCQHAGWLVCILINKVKCNILYTQTSLQMHSAIIMPMTSARPLNALSWMSKKRCFTCIRLNRQNAC